MLLLKAVLLCCALRSTQGEKCLPGSYQDYKTHGCRFCPTGTYQPLADASYCLECRQGTYSTGMGMKSPWDCKNCASGTYAVNTSLCKQCPQFTTSPQGSFKIKECRAKGGYYAALGQQGWPCPENSFCPPGTTTPTPCPYGTASTSKSVECSPVWKELRLYNWVFGGVWICLFFVSIGWSTWHTTNSYEQKSRGEIQIKIAP